MVEAPVISATSSFTESHLGEDPPDHAGRLEVIPRHGAGSGGVAGVVGLDRLDARHGPFRSFEGEEALARGEDLGEAGVLDDDRPSGREVADRAAGEPPAPGHGVEVLRDADLSARALDVGAVVLRGPGDRLRGRHAPAELAPAVHGGLGPAHGDLDGDRGDSGGKVLHAGELHLLGAVDPPLPFHRPPKLFQVMTVVHVSPAGRGAQRSQRDGRARGHPAKPQLRQEAPGRPIRSA